MSFGAAWAEEWPDTMTLGIAAEEMEFDLCDDDDLNAVLIKASVTVADFAAYSIEELAENDAEDRFGQLEAGLDAGGHGVPPVVILPDEGMRDGFHRALLAQANGLDQMPAYMLHRAAQRGKVDV